MPTYLIYGLRVRSSIPLHGLSAAADLSREVDVSIEMGPVLDRASNAPRTGSFEARPDHVFLWHPHVGAVLAYAGRELVVEPVSGADEGLLRSILLGQGFAALFLQRGVPALHASAVALEEGVVAFVGQKGEGKSTTAAALVAAGHALVTDDLLVVTPSEKHRAVVAPGYAFLKLSPESAEAAGAASAALAALSDRSSKRVWATPTVPTPLPLLVIYELAYGDDARGVHVESVPAMQAFATVMHHSFAGALAPATNQGPVHLRACAELAQAVPVYRLVRPRDLTQIEAVVQAIEAHGRAVQAELTPIT